MNKEQAQQTFVEQNLKFLTSGTFDKKSLKRMTREFFYDRHNNKFGQPKQGDICEWIVRYQLRGGIPNDTILEQISIFPIFKDIGLPKQNMLKGIISSTHESGLASDELEILARTSVFETVAATQSSELKERIELENENKRAELDELDRQLQKKREENESLPSVLEAEVIEEPEFDPTVDEKKTWWEEFYLKENPFPLQDGLSKIDPSDYDGVVVKTKPYQLFIENVEKNDDYVFNTAFMLVGSFGHGKTTFQDYLIYYLTQRNILPIRIPCFRSQADCNGYLDAFTGKLIPELKKYADNTAGLANLTETEDIIVALCKNILTSKEGIVIMLDDYHKFQTSVEPLYEFLGNLQLYKDELAREDCNVGFIVSALPKWLVDLDEHQQMSGFFDSSPIRMTDPTPEFICDLFNNRMATYCFDSTPRQLDIDYVRQIFANTGRSGNYRDYLKLVLDELNRNRSSVVSTPIDIGKDTLDKLEAVFKSNSTVYEPLQKLIKASGFKKYSKEQVNRCLEILVTVHNLDGVEEEDRLFVDNTFYFSRLQQLGLISKRRMGKGSGRFEWIGSKSLSRVVNDIKNQHDYRMSDYFLKLFAGSRFAATKVASNAGVDQEISEFKRAFGGFRKDLEMADVENIEKAMNLFDRFENSGLSETNKSNTVQTMHLAMDSISTALFGIDGTGLLFRSISVTNVEEKWTLHHHDHEELCEFYDKCRVFEKSKKTVDFGFCVAKGRECFIRIVGLLETTIRQTVVSNTDALQHLHTQPLQNIEDRNIYVMLAESIFTANRLLLFGCIDKITDHIELRLRQYLYVTSVLVFGQSDYDKQIPEEVRNYAHRSIKTDGKYSGAINLFNGFTRPQFRNIFCVGGTINNLIVKKLDLKWSEGDRKLFFDLYVENNIKASHQKIDSFSPQQRAQYVNYCRLGMQLLNALNVQISSIPLEHAFHFSDSDGNYKSNNSASRFSFSVKEGKQKISNGSCGRSDDVRDAIFVKEDLIFKHVVEKNIYDKVKTIVMSKFDYANHCLIDLSDYEFICQHYSVSYDEFVVSLCYLYWVDSLVELHPWFGSQVVLKKKN